MYVWLCGRRVSVVGRVVVVVAVVAAVAVVAGGLLRVAEPGVKRKSVAPRHGLAQLESVVDTGIANLGVHSTVERLAGGDAQSEDLRVRI